MDKIRGYMKKIKNEVKFGKSGEGHRLNDPTPSPRDVASAQPRPTTTSRPPPESGSAARAAAEAAHQRYQRQTSSQQSAAGNSRTADSVRRQAQRELEREKDLGKQLQQALEIKDHYFGNRPVSVEYSPVVDHSGLLFKCPDIFDEDLRLPYDELQEQIENTLLAQWDSEPLVADTLLFLTFNQKDLEKLNAGKEIMCKYFANIIANPNEEKYQRIRLQNPVYREKVEPLKYASRLLQTSGFATSDDNEFLVYKEKSVEPLELAQDILLSSAPIQVQLDQNLKIFQPTKEHPSIPPMQPLPKDPLFYQATVGDILREKQRQKEMVEREEMLRTKAMRERDEKPETNVQYKYTVIRIRMPDGMILQVLFPSNDPVSFLFDYLRSNCLAHDWLLFSLVSIADRRAYESQEELTKTFNQCDLVPTALLSFQWNEKALRDVQAQTPDFPVNSFIKPEVLATAGRL